MGPRCNERGNHWKLAQYPTLPRSVFSSFNGAALVSSAEIGKASQGIGAATQELQWGRARDERGNL